MTGMKISNGVKAVWAFISRANKYIDETAPWALAKDPDKKQELANVMYNLIESMRIISVLIAPYMPVTAEKVWQQLNIPGEFKDVRLEDIRTWGGTPAGMHIGEAQQLFPRIELDKEDKVQPPKKEKQPKKEQGEKKAAAPAEDGLITIDDFGKVKLQVVEIVEAEPVPKADKLLKLIVDTGEGKRQVVSGIAQHYAINELIGKRVILVMNLKPAKLRGVESQGMILAATKGDQLEVVTVDMPVGSVVR